MKAFRIILYFLGAVVLLLVALVVFFAFVPISLDLTPHKGIAEKAASRALGRAVRIHGKIELSTSLWPALDVADMHLGNPEGFEEQDFARMKRARLDLGILPLLRGKIQSNTLHVTGLSVNLRENKAGAVNWTFKPSGAGSPEPAAVKETGFEGEPPPLTSDSFVVQEIKLEDITVSYFIQGMDEPLGLTLKRFEGAAPAGKQFLASMDGESLGEPFTGTLKAGSLEEILEESRTWAEIDIEIAETRIFLKGAFDFRQASPTVQVKASIRGKRLDSLNRLLEMDLPPVKSYEAAADLFLQNERAELTDFNIRVGKSRLSGKMNIDASRERPVASAEFTAPLIQINDFDLGDWSASPVGPPGNGASGNAAPPGPSEKSAETSKPLQSNGADETELPELLSPEVLERADARVTIHVTEVLSGNDKLGGGRLTAALKNGRISIDPLKLDLPGGELRFIMSMKPDEKSSEASVRVSAKNFDLGVLARRAKPDTDMGGSLNLDIDLKTSAGSISELLPNAGGHFDFSGYPENLKAGILDLWAVNLLTAIVSQSEKKASKINCVVGRWRMKAGLLTADTFVVDTTKMRICGRGSVDFRKEFVDLFVAPAAKKPEFFSLATPFEVHGAFSDFEMGLNKPGLVGSLIVFMTSPVHVPLRRLAGEGLPAEGGDVCGMEIGGQNRPTGPPPGCGQ